MFRRLLFPLLLAPLALAPAAFAKGIVSVQACGADGCRDVTAQVGHQGFATTATGSAPRPGPLYRFESEIGHDGEHVDTVTAYVTTDGRRMRLADEPTPTWYRVTSEQRTVLLGAVRGMQPLPASALAQPGATTPLAPQARVVETFRVPAAPAPREDAGGNSATAAVIIAGGLLLLGGAGVAGRRISPRRRARRTSAAA